MAYTTVIAVVAAIAITLLFLLHRAQQRRRRRESKFVRSRSSSHSTTDTSKSLDDDDDNKPLPEHVRKSFTFWAGGLAGVLSAATTHQLDVLKTLRHVGKQMPNTMSELVVGLPMGSFAQGFRFAVTLVLNMTLQKKLNEWEQSRQSRSQPKGHCSLFISFLVSMLAAGSGEFLANPPVVIKNYQITHNKGIMPACTDLWTEGGVPRFFNGVGMGVLRKSLANAIVLQAIGPTKSFVQFSLPALGSDEARSKVILSFVAGSLTGAFAEVLTNHPDQVKTMTQAGIPFMEAFMLATKNPFRGAFWAGLRKGIIRGINWGGLSLFMLLFEKVYNMRKARRRRLMYEKTITSFAEKDVGFSRRTSPLDEQMDFVRKSSPFTEEAQP
eukprot:TRINITY_DN3389_c0_g1_i1.p1 TRINITY_DN3389_c0_g1~~TRINITY_DN3389_c0_g1_i1.p1  ORF type:complete len:391 (-),score=64.41 TRINITY_DN3389_c0_g1_i1:436-1584(-)